MASGFINSPLNNEKHWKFGAVWLATTSLLATASWLVALLLIAGGVWLLHRMQPHEDVRWRFSDWALLVLASLGMLVMATLLTWGREWYEAYQKDISGFDAADFAASWAMETSRSVSLVSAALPLGIVFGVLICVARLAGQHHLPKPCMKMISRWVAQRASFFLFVTMLMYAVLLIPLPRLAKPIDESTERLLGGEVSAMKAWAALQKVPSGSANR